MSKPANAALVATKESNYNDNWKGKKSGDTIYFRTTRPWYHNLIIGAVILVRVQGANDVMMVCKFKGIVNVVGKTFDLELEVMHNDGISAISAKRIYEMTSIMAGAEFSGFDWSGKTWIDFKLEFK